MRNNLGLQKVLVAVVGIVWCLEGLVVEPVTTHPLVNATLEVREMVRDESISTYDREYANIVKFIVSWDFLVSVGDHSA